MADLHGKVIAITGGGRGIGLATARALIDAGARVGIGDIDLDVATKAAADLGTSCAAFSLDVTDEASFAAFLDGVEGTYGPLDVLINNAGIMAVGEFAKEEDTATDAMIAINLRGVLRGCRLVIPRMAQRNSGHLVNIASMAGKVGIPNLVTYSATKHAVVGLSDALRVELQGTGIKVSTVMPNVVDTRLGAGAAKNVIKALQPEDVAEAILHVIATGKNEVTVPRWLMGLSAPAAGLPSRARQWLQKLLGGNKTFTRHDASARADYEDQLRGR